MIVRIEPGLLGGTVNAIPSKSMAHRLLICAALADQPTQLDLKFQSEDIEATRRCLSALGTVFTRNDQGLLVRPWSKLPYNPLLDCGESGSTLRFLLPVAAALCPAARFTGSGRLPDRPISDLAKAMSDHGVRFSSERLPFAASGVLQPGHYSISGSISSQYLSGLLLAMAVLPGNSSLEVTTELESRPYVEMTIQALRQFGASVSPGGSGWQVAGQARLQSPGHLPVEGDWSNTGFFLTAGALGSDITVKGLDPASGQGDRQILSVLEAMGASFSSSAEGLRVLPGSLIGFTVDMRQIPDALPILAVAATAARGETRLIHAGRLRYKESDRLTATAELIRSLGGQVRELPDQLIIQGSALTGGTVQSFGDHRIVMAAAIAATVAQGPVTILGAEAVRKSYPDYFKDYQSLGGNVHVL